MKSKISCSNFRSMIRSLKKEKKFQPDINELFNQKTELKSKASHYNIIWLLGYTINILSAT